MADYLVTDTELTSIADAIRTAGETSGALTFPAGFISAINAIPGGGGGDGLEYETGVYEPEEDISSAIINFSKTHDRRPICVIFEDVTSEAPEQNSNIYWVIASWYDAFGSSVPEGTSNRSYAKVYYSYKTASSTSASAYTITSLTGLTATDMPCWLRAADFRPSSFSASRYWRAGRTYRWIAVWGPTT